MLYSTSAITSAFIPIQKTPFYLDISKFVDTFAFNLTKCTMNEINRIKVVLVEQKKTGKWLAEKLGVSVITKSRWCSNATQLDLQTLNRIA